MDATKLVNETETKLKAAVSHFQEELKKLRTGRAHAGMLDGIMVEAYGQPMPLISVGSVTAPEPQLLQITPFDPNNLQVITQAIRDNQTLGLNPMDDGRVVRIPIPQLTTERRQQIVKLLGEKTEETMISMRNVRHDALKSAEEVKKTAGENEFARVQKQVDEMMGKYKSEIESLARTKESEIMTL